MTKEEADADFGKIILQLEHKVVRAKHEGGKLMIYIHEFKEGAEQLPLGYLIGDNLVIVKD